MSQRSVNEYGSPTVRVKPLPADGGPPLSQLVLALRTDQLKQWHHGDRKLAEDYLAQHPELGAESEQALDLVYGEFLLREELGEKPTLEEYRQRFPQFADTLRRQIELHRALDSGTCSSQSASQAVTISPLPSQASAPLEHGWPQVNGYQILEVLGRGGMGIVYKAREESLNRLVALKMIRTGVAAGSEHLGRFYAEAKTVARLQHPNIVQIYHVGEQQGVPYLALELVEGGHLSQFLNGKPLASETAARLIQDLAQAIHFAHQRGIIHRDLKPTNILLGSPSRQGWGETDAVVASATDCSLPKITDFGLAKQLGDKARQTQSGQIMGTPSYMAPEQAEGKSDKVGPAVDVYALGAILYGLLTGRPPFQGASTIDTLLLLRSADPVPPRRLRPQVSRDLEAICLQCLKKDPLERFCSAQDLADDLGRFLAGEPIRARPVSVAERAAKWMRRRPAAALMIALASLVVVGFLATWAVFTASLQRERDLARIEHDRAEENALQADQEKMLAVACAETAQQARQHSDANAKLAGERSELALDTLKTLVYEVHDKLEDVPGPSGRSLRQALLTAALPGLERLTQATERSAADHWRADAHLRLGDICILLEGKTAEARQHYEKARSIVVPLVKADKNNLVALRDLGQVEIRLGDVKLQEHQFEAARGHFRAALALHEQVVGAEPQGLLGWRGLALNYGKLGDVGLKLRDPDTMDYYRKSLTWYDKSAEAFPQNVELSRDTAVLYGKIGTLSLEKGDLDSASAYYVKFLGIMERLAALPDRPRSVQARRDLSVAYNKVGDLSMHKGEAVAARDLYQKGLALREQLLAEDPQNLRAQRDVSVSYERLGDICLRLGDVKKARAFQERALANRGALATRDPQNAQSKYDLIIIHQRLCDAALEMDEVSAARAQLQQALELAQQLDARKANTIQAPGKMAELYGKLGDLSLSEADYSAARSNYRQGLEIARRLAKENPQDNRIQEDLARIYFQLGRLERIDLQLTEAIRWYEQSDVLLDRLEKAGAFQHRAAAYADRKKSLTRDLHLCRATIRAAGDQDAVLTEPKEMHLDLLLLQSSLDIRQEKPANALATAKVIRERFPKSGTALYNVVCILAQCSQIPLAGKQPQTPGTAVIAESERLAEEAVTLLKQLFEAGYFKSHSRQRLLLRDKDLDALRGRDDFKKVVNLAVEKAKSS